MLHKAQMYITENKNYQKHDYLNKILSNVECHAGDSGNISLQFLTKLYSDLLFLLLEIVQLGVFTVKWPEILSG